MWPGGNHQMGFPINPLINPHNPLHNPSRNQKSDIPKQELFDSICQCQWDKCEMTFTNIEALVDHLHKDHLEKDGKRCVGGMRRRDN